jgi:hypothetical protein
VIGDLLPNNGTKERITIGVQEHARSLQGLPHSCGTFPFVYCSLEGVWSSGTIAPAMVEIVKSPADKKEYRYVVLENGLRALLIHDSEMCTVVEEGKEEARSDSGSEAEEESGSEVGQGSLVL